MDKGSFFEGKFLRTCGVLSKCCLQEMNLFGAKESDVQASKVYIIVNVRACPTLFSLYPDDAFWQGKRFILG